MQQAQGDIQIPTSRLDTPDVGGVRPELGAHRGPWPVPWPQGTRRGKAPLGCGSQSVRAEGPSSGSAAAGSVAPVSTDAAADSSLLDSYKNNRNKFCGSWSVVGRIEQGGKRYTHIARLGCKRWACPVCGPKRAYQLSRAIIREAEAHQLQRFLTLTLDPRNCTAEESNEYIRDVWAKFRTYLKRRYGKSIAFITVLELQKSGYAHLHILIDRYIPQAWIQEIWQRLGGGKYVNIKFVDIHRISAYLSKYLTKEIFLSQFKPGTRRFTTSRNIKLFVKAPKGTWQISRSYVDVRILSGSDLPTCANIPRHNVPSYGPFSGELGSYIALKEIFG